MPRKIQTSFPKNRSKTICAIGDSLTLNQQYQAMACEFYPEQLAVLLRGVGCDVKARNFGWPGDNTTGILRRIRVMTQWETPEVAIIMAGVNDPGDARLATTLTRSGTTATFTATSAHSLSTGDVVTVSGSNLSPYNVANAVVTVSSATVFTYTMASDPGGSSSGTPRFDHQTQANIEAMIIALRNGVYGVTGSQTLLPAGVSAGVRYLVRNDTSTTGGVTGGIGPSTLTGTHAGTQLWVSRNYIAGELGWSRISADNTGVSRIIVMSTQWRHFVNGTGDTLATPYSSYAIIRGYQQAAATAQSATYFDLYTYQRNMIVNGYEGELSGTWAATDNDQHPSPYAGWTWANGLLTHIQAQTGWIADLT